MRVGLQLVFLHLPGVAGDWNAMEIALESGPVETFPLVDDTPWRYHIGAATRETAKQAKKELKAALESLPPPN